MMNTSGGTGGGDHPPHHIITSHHICRKGGSAYAIQPHREVRPESGLSIYEVYDMKAYRIMTPFWARGEGDEEEEEKGRGVC